MAMLPSSFVESAFATRAEYEASLLLPDEERAAAEEAAAAARTPPETLLPPSDRPALGGRSVTAAGINDGLIRCPRCSSRLLTKVGAYMERDAVLWVPSRPEPKEGEDADAEIADDEYVWSEVRHRHWWRVEDVNDVDNIGLSRVVEAPPGPLKLILCTDCRYGPFGYQLGTEPQLWLCCDMLQQQDASAADDAADFVAPDGIDMASLQRMIESGAATVQYHVTFAEQRLCMLLQDSADGSGVELGAFTEFEGQPGPAELSGKVQVGDRVSRVNGASCRGLNYEGVLSMIIDAPRPVTLHWERPAGRPAGAAPAERVPHLPFKPPPSACGEE